jgi:DNA adenine methylase
MNSGHVIDTPELTIQADPLRPVVRWAGGKSVMVNELVSLLPPKWNRYIEPMSGGAALFFHVRPARAVLADINSDLITYYSVLRDNPIELIRRLQTMTASREFYYALRESRPRGRIQRAVRFAYLNRLAWNGLYRVNREGRFNVPIGDRLPAAMWNEANLLRASAVLAKARLVNRDFRTTARHTVSGDFVFFDPPYPRGCREQVGFNRYASDVFTIKDHVELADVIADMTRRSVQVMLTLTEADHLEEIYPRSLHRNRFESKALIACNGSARRNVTELILTNY